MKRSWRSPFRQWWFRLRQAVVWLTPGLGVKRWVVILLAGVTLLGVGLAILLLQIYRESPDTWWLPYLSTLSLRFLARPMRAVIFAVIGLTLLGVGIWGLNRALLKPFVRPGSRILKTMTNYHLRERGPRIVAIGGGTGLSALLRGLKTQSHNITAIVTVADDGGSSGELRRTMGILPPGDIRNCLAALSNDEALMSQVFQYRFAAGAGLNGHSLGNLFITALTELTGSFEEAVAESGRVLAVQGRVLPSTLRNVCLVADVAMQDSTEVTKISGESLITKAEGQIHRVWLEPNSPPAFPPAIQDILAADLIVVGPGSLYTSIIPNLLVPELADALRISRALKFYVCNVTTQPGETTGYSAGDHVKTVEKYLAERIFDVVIVNTQQKGNLPAGISWVPVEPALDEERPIYKANLLDPDKPSHHDSARLAQIIMDLYSERTGPLVNDSKS